MRKLIYGGAAVLAAVVLIFAVVTVTDIAGVGGDERVDIRLEEGDGTAAVAQNLKAAGLINSGTVFKIYARMTGEHIYQVGVHTLNTSMSYGEIIEELEKMPEQEEVTVLIPEGYELRQIADTLEEKGLINREVFMREVQVGNFDYEFVAQIPERENRLEGYLFPDTYKFSAEQSEHEIIDIMLANFEKLVIPVYETAQSERSLDDIVNLASIIEREAAGDEERGRIASVFVNRLNKDIKLESCATVQYLLKERKSILSNADTQIASPYNTYLNSGLPAGPIAAPGIKSIEAALYPEQTNYLYFLAPPEGGSSLFAETYEQHLENQRQTQGN